MSAFELLKGIWMINIVYVWIFKKVDVCCLELKSHESRKVFKNKYCFYILALWAQPDSCGAGRCPFKGFLPEHGQNPVPVTGEAGVFLQRLS